MFRALGGDQGLAIKIAQSTHHQGKRNWLQRLSGFEQRIELAWQDHEALYLPSSINLFPRTALNRELYFWLAALAVEMRAGSWFVENQQATARLLKKFPGLRVRYQRLVYALLLLRPEITTLSQDSAFQEQAIYQALIKPGSVASLPSAAYSWHPIHCWFHPYPPLSHQGQSTSPARIEKFEQGGNTKAVQQDERRRKAERTDAQERKDGFMMFFQSESILSWAE